MTSAALPVLASIPSPDVSFITLGPLTIHFYALCILLGIVVATLWTNRRLTARGAEPWVVIDIALIAVPLAIIGARIFHVVTHPGFYFGEDKDFWAIFRIWEGGIAIFGALIGGAIGAWLGCKWTGIRFWSFADALAPGLLLAQALGRFGNWFNQELYGLPTDLPWGLEIDYPNAAWPAGLAEGTLFHPTFLYEVIWNVMGVCVLVWAGRRFSLQWGRLFGLYLAWYSAGRIVWESIRIDPSEVFFGLRTNVWAAVFGVIVGLAIFFVQGRRHFGAEPSPYQRGREWTAPGAVHSGEADAFVDVSAPPTSEASSDQATSSVTTR
ncbi:prolipoprotein diacylglyceryl transferase [Microbacterium dauci]|uniref:Phosphatidylglycerol--prolipoprotein diacylglyceryl transferase n=1 Tax=Microbacterium dauci TaxID=3048008 RepID=A0ABT6ZC36_9MICO|nr:prolipoprotein diacylglyceryl transferase [Microbacterium sp. LX3-4]MDJ1113721.1 prolipoprotein diacylglyceryl transferase [Microbacterium sp. LX3-4]